MNEAATAAPSAQLVTRLLRGCLDRFAVKEPETVVGSLAGVGVTISAEGVSRRHAKLAHDGRSWWLESLSPRAGTFLNGLLVVMPERVRHLDVITLGRNVHLVFVISAGEATGTGKLPGIVRATLLREGGDGVATEIPLGEVTLGRSSSNTFMVRNPAVSKIHARIQRTTRQLVLQDLESVNGTFVNDERVTTSVLQDGDTLCLAALAEARFRVTVETGEVVDGELAAPPLAEALAAHQTGSLPRPASAEWKTKYDYDSMEIAEMKELRRRISEQRDALRVAPPIQEIRLAAPSGPLRVAEPGEYVLGCSHDAGLRVEHATVSPRHAVVRLSADRSRAEVLHAGGSTGTSLNGMEITSSRPLADGDVIQLGELELRVTLLR